MEVQIHPRGDNGTRTPNPRLNVLLKRHKDVMRVGIRKRCTSYTYTRTGRGSPNKNNKIRIYGLLDGFSPLPPLSSNMKTQKTTGPNQNSSETQELRTPTQKELLVQDGIRHSLEFIRLGSPKGWRGVFHLFFSQERRDFTPFYSSRY